MFQEIEPYRERIKYCLGTSLFYPMERPFGYTIVRRNGLRLPRDIDRVTIGGLDLNLDGKDFLDFVLLLQKPTGIRSHEEEYQEIVKNIGDTHIVYEAVDKDGFYHGFSVDKEGLLYVAKALLPGFIKGNFFRIPENTYKPDMPSTYQVDLNPGKSFYSMNCPPSRR